MEEETLEKLQNESHENNQIIVGALIMFLVVMVMAIAWFIGVFVGDIIGSGINFIIGR